MPAWAPGGAPLGAHFGAPAGASIGAPFLSATVGAPVDDPDCNSQVPWELGVATLKSPGTLH